MKEFMNRFYNLIGEIVILCQRIEFDIKVIYAGMLQGDIDSNFNKVNNYTLGQVISKLEKLDFSDNEPYFNQNSYKILKSITEQRNHFTHKTFQEYGYEQNQEKQINKVKKEFEKARRFHEQIYKLVDKIELHRIKVLERYRT